MRFIVILMGSALAVTAVFISVVLGAVIGAFAGWILGIMFPDTTLALAQGLGLDVSPWQLGVIFGFVGSFFRSSASASL